MKSPLLLIAISYILLPGMLAAQTAPQKFESELFDITGPASWEMKADENNWMPVKYLRGDTKTPGVRESINVSYANLNESMDYFLTGLAKQIEKMEIEERGTGKVSGLKADWAIYTYEYNGIKLKGKVYLVMIPEKLGLYIGYMAKEQSYSQYLALFEETLKSVKIYGAEAGR